MHCLNCHIRMEMQASWRLFLGLVINSILCAQCKSQLEPIEGEICKRCGRSLAKLNTNFHNGSLCNDCIKWESDETWQGLLTKNRSLYNLNDSLKDMIYRFKYRGDAELVKVFADSFKKLHIAEFSNHVIVPIPLSQERRYERGFNQAELLACTIGEPVLVLNRVSNEEKQSKKTKEERRILSNQPIFVIENSLKKYIDNYDIIIIDDIYTTGSTINQAAQVLKLAGAKTVSSMTIAR